MTTLSLQRTIDGLLASADSATLQVTDSGGVVIVAPAVVSPSAVGVYSYDTTFLQPGEYTAQWTFTVFGQQDDVVYRTFTIDPPVSVTKGVTLADIERAIAKRVGPYYRYPVAAGTLTYAQITRMQSSIDSGDYEDLWILRRGRLMSGGLVNSFDSDDRQRAISSYNPGFGQVFPDRGWNNSPTIGESIELHYLDPEQLLRPIAQAALERCFLWDTAIITNVTTSTIREINVTAAVPWITMASQIRNVEFGRVNRMRTRLMYWDAFQVGPDVYMKISGLPPGDLRITALRQHSTLVNGEMSYSGPNDDDDILNIRLSYAAAAGHIEAWKQATPLLTPLAAEGLGVPMKLVAAEFTKASMAYVKNEPELLQIAFGEDTRYLDQVGNA